MDRAKANNRALWTIALAGMSAIFVSCGDGGSATEARRGPVKSAAVQEDEADEKKLPSDGKSTVAPQKAARHPETALPESLPEATKQSVVALRRMGAWVFVEEDGPKTSISVNFLGPRVRNPIDITPAALKHLQNLTNLEEVYLGRSAISDDQLAVLGGITTLTDLSLNNTRVTDAGLAHLARLDRLNDLGLADTKITDAGLQHLRAMKDLSGLSLEGTGVTDVGLRSLKDLSHLRDLDLSSTKVTDKGLANLAGLRLHSLRLNDTRVTNAGLTHLKGMDELVQLELYDTQVTDAGLEQLRRLGLRNLDVDNVHIESTIAENPTVLTPVPEEQVARVDEVLWWLPPDSETVCVVQAPFPLDWLKSQSDLNATNNLRPGSPVFVEEKYDAMLAGKRIALYVSGDRHFRLAEQLPGVEAVVFTWFEGCRIFVFEGTLGDAGDAFMNALREQSTKVEVMHDCEVLRFDAEPLGRSGFFARPRPDVILHATDRGYMAETLARMAKRGETRAFPEELAEWKYVDRKAPEWAIRHYDRTEKDDPTSPLSDGPGHDPEAIGLAYSARAGDKAVLTYLSRNQQARKILKPLGAGAEFRQPEQGVVEIIYSVRELQALTNFRYKLGNILGFLLLF